MLPRECPQRLPMISNMSQQLTVSWPVTPKHSSERLLLGSWGSPLRGVEATRWGPAQRPHWPSVPCRSHVSSGLQRPELEVRAPFGSVVSHLPRLAPPASSREESPHLPSGTWTALRPTEHPTAWAPLSRSPPVPPSSPPLRSEQDAVIGSVDRLSRPPEGRASQQQLFPETWRLVASQS